MAFDRGVQWLKMAKWEVFAWFRLLAPPQNEARSDLSDSLSRNCLEIPWWYGSGIRCSPWRTGDTPPTCPTTNGIASVRSFAHLKGEDVPRYTTPERYWTPSSTS